MWSIEVPVQHQRVNSLINLAGRKSNCRRVAISLWNYNSFMALRGETFEVITFESHGDFIGRSKGNIYLDLNILIILEAAQESDYFAGFGARNGRPNFLCAERATT